MGEIVDGQFRDFEQPIPYSIDDSVDDLIEKGENADIAVILLENNSSIRAVAGYAQTTLSNQASQAEKLEAQERLLRTTNGLVRGALETTQEIKRDREEVQSAVNQILANQEQNAKQLLAGLKGRRRAMQLTSP